MPTCSGIVRLFEVINEQRVFTHEVKNAFVNGGADILMRSALGNPAYNIAAVYLEFQNGGSGVITDPSFNLGDGRSYYDELTGSVDYLRVRLTLNPVFSASASGYSSNTATLYFHADTDEGIHGLEFSAAAGSRVYGAALVATPSGDNLADDIIYARTYWGATPKVVTANVFGLSWITSITA